MNVGNGNIDVDWPLLRDGYCGYLRPGNYFWTNFYYKFMRILYAREHNIRERTARYLNSDHPIRIDPQKGYRLVDLSGHEVVRKALEQCDHMRRREDFQSGTNQSKKEFLRNFLVDVDQPDNKAILDLVCSPLILGPVAEYLGGVPVLHRVSVSWSPNKNFGGETQKFHMDREDWRQVKCQIYLEDVDENSGPLTIIPAAGSKKVFERIRKRGQVKYKFTWLDDDTVHQAMRDEREIPLCGPRGSVAFVDTCNCFHYGSRPAQRERWVLYLHFASPFSIDLPVWGREKLVRASVDSDSAADEIRSQLLGPRKSHMSKASKRWLAELTTAFWAEIASLTPEQEQVILVDDYQLSRNDRAYLPFMERDGAYFGQPPDDDVAIAELERMRESGARFIVFAWCSLWWFEYYKGFYRHLRSTYRCRTRNRRLVVFDLS